MNNSYLDSYKFSHWCTLYKCNITISKIRKNLRIPWNSSEYYMGCKKLIIHQNEIEKLVTLVYIGLIY